MDELYTFYTKKRQKCYVYTAIAITRYGKYYYFYYLSKYKSAKELFHFSIHLPTVDTIYCDGNMAYDNVFGHKAIMGKGKHTNIIENLNSQLRDNISYLVRKSKAHCKSLSWLNGRLASFFNDKNSHL